MQEKQQGISERDFFLKTRRAPPRIRGSLTCRPRNTVPLLVRTSTPNQQLHRNTSTPSTTRPRSAATTVLTLDALGLGFLGGTVDVLGLELRQATLDPKNKQNHER